MYKMYNMTSVSILYFHPLNKFQIYNMTVDSGRSKMKAFVTRQLGRKQNKKKIAVKLHMAEIVQKLNKAAFRPERKKRGRK